MVVNRIYIFILLLSSLSGQKEIDFNSLEKINDIFSIKGENTPVNARIYQYKNGKKEIMGIMKNGKKEGIWVEWHNYGRRLQETYKNGVLDGFVSIFYKNGQKEWRHTYNNGVLEGNYTRWHSNGKRAIDGFFENGIPVGIWAWRDKGGNIIKKETFKREEKSFIRGMKEYVHKEMIK